MKQPVVDCVIIGGSYGGLSAALALGRSLRQTVVVDEGLPCNRFTPHSQNFLTRDGAKPAEIAAIGKQQIQDTYKTVEFVDSKAVSVKKRNEEATAPLFDVWTEHSSHFQAKSLIFASGVKDVFPENVPGFAECWGTSVIHCPYCHGYEFRDQPTGLWMSSGDASMHMAPLVRNLTPNLKLFGNVQELEFSDENVAALKANDISIVETPIKEIKHENGYLQQVILQDDTAVPLKALYAALPFELNAKQLLEELECELDENGYLKVDGMQKTNVPGVFGVGDATTMFRSVANAVRGGNVAGAVVNMEQATSEFAEGRQGTNQ